MDISDNIKKRTSLTAVFYNRSFGFMVVPYAVERNMRCHIAIEPTIILPPKTSFDELGSAVKETIKIATNAPETDIEKNVNEFLEKDEVQRFSRFFKPFSIDKRQFVRRYVENQKMGFNAAKRIHQGRFSKTY